MEIKNIATERRFNNRVNLDLVFEWEDVFKEKLGAEFFYLNKLSSRKRICNNIPFIEKFFNPSDNTLLFEIKADVQFKRIFNNRHIIPVIIDFYLKENEFENFAKKYSKNPVIFVSNRVVYEKLKNCSATQGLNIEHLALSLSDKYKIDSNTRFEKKYDLVRVGRSNPVLMEYLDTYAKRHPDFTYVTRDRSKLKNNEYAFPYFTNHGEYVGNFTNREQFVDLIRQSRVALYSTPGIDEPIDYTNGYNQMTPRFLELLAAGCNVIARYNKNADTDFYEIGNFSPSVNSYEEFEHRMDLALSSPPDMSLYSSYLKKHYTSTTVDTFNKILTDY